MDIVEGEIRLKEISRMQEESQRSAIQIRQNDYNENDNLDNEGI